MKDRLTQTARQLRKNSTEAEKLLWKHLQAEQLEGCKFRRQAPIGNYIVDFACFEKKIVIELDGGQHAIEHEKDIERDHWFVKQGFSVLRFWNNDVLENCEGVLENIKQAAVSPSPSPSH